MASYTYLTSTGVIVPDTSTIQSEVEAEFRAALGEDLITSPETLAGALIASEVSSRISVIRNNAQVANQINPNVAGGTFLDSIYALTGGSRNRATNSTIQLICTGESGTVIPQGSRAADANGNNWLASAALVIGVDGSITGSFAAENTGPIPASPNTITNIVDSVLGWETVNNTTSATLGQNQQSDISVRTQRGNELALQGRNTSEATSSNLSNVTGVRSFAYRENTSNTTQVIDGITLVPHSIWVAVDGGSDMDIATALNEAKSSGSGYNGSESVPITDPSSNQSVVVNFDRPTEIELLIRVTIRPGVTVDPTNQVVDSVFNYANGSSPVGDGFTVGADVVPYEISAAINNDSPSVTVTNVETALDVDNPTYITTVREIAVNEVARIQRGNIEVVLV